MSTINISGINKAQLLAALFNASKAQGMGLFQETGATMSQEEAQELLTHCVSFDYVRGRVIKVELDGDEVRHGLYDRDNGQGAFQRVVDKLRASA